MTTNHDILRTTEQAMHAVLDALSENVGFLSSLHSETANTVLRACIGRLKMVYTLMRYRALAHMDETTLIHSETGLPSSVEVSKVYQDTRGTKIAAAVLTKEKTEIVEYILEKGCVPTAYVNKALRTAYCSYAANVTLSDDLIAMQSSEETRENRSVYWCSWFHHVTNGKFVIYLMRFEVDSTAEEVGAILDRIARETLSGNSTSPGIFGARIDEAIDTIHPKEVYGWSINSLTLGEDLISSDTEWKEGEFLVDTTYEYAVSNHEADVSKGLFSGKVRRTVWEIGGDANMKERLVRRQKRTVFAPHSVLQRMSHEIQTHSLVPIVTNVN